jgi:hypothetical protein
MAGSPNEYLSNSLDSVTERLSSKKAELHLVVEEKSLSVSLDQCLRGLEPKEPITTFFIIEEEILFDGLSYTT